MEGQSWMTEGAFALTFAYMLTANLASFILFGWDKHCARRASRRVPERTLLTFAFLGGTIGAVLGQRTFRHKIQKESFRTRLLPIVFLHVASLGAILECILWRSFAEG